MHNPVGVDIHELPKSVRGVVWAKESSFDTC